LFIWYLSNQESMREVVNKYNIVPLSFINSWMKYSILRVNPTGEFPFDLAFMYACAFSQNVFTTISTSNPS
jgi:hypothetical protein